MLIIPTFCLRFNTNIHPARDPIFIHWNQEPRDLKCLLLQFPVCGRICHKALQGYFCCLLMSTYIGRFLCVFFFPLVLSTKADVGHIKSVISNNKLLSDLVTLVLPLDGLFKKFFQTFAVSYKYRWANRLRHLELHLLYLIDIPH